ncbi:MAG: hypothetical protein DMG64_00470 [Acidobacteria bacterium]|nr:MAG: hypothetical protein DMG64_00470 [Acidobacteriota bacterium]PYY23269.1 MAG: hypothetical protein DMG62_09250 [Acidobacteriota bacterium]
MQLSEAGHLLINACSWAEVITRGKAPANQMMAMNPIAYRFIGGVGPGSRTGAGGSVCGLAGGSLMGTGGESGGSGSPPFP